MKAAVTSWFALAVLGCTTRGSDRPITVEPPGPMVEVAPVVDTVVSEPVTATGTLAVKEEAPLSFKIGGVVEAVGVDVGDVVRTGQVLATLAQAEIGSIVTKAEAGRAKAERDVARAERLYQDSVISRERLDDIRTGRDLAEADLTAARFNAQYAVIRAPRSGTVLRRTAEPGQVIGAGMPVVVIGADAGGQVVRVGLVDRDLARLALGDRGVIRVATSDRDFAVRVARIGSAANPGTGTYPVELALAEPIRLGQGLASGLVARVSITPASSERVRLIPIGALLEADGDSGWVVSLDSQRQARRHRVRVGGLLGGWVMILGGLDGIDGVVARGAAYLSDGERARLAGGGQ